MPRFPFTTTETLRAHFVGGLVRMIDYRDSSPPGLGHFILAASNALLDPRVYEQTSDKLGWEFTDLCVSLGKQVRNGQLLHESDDDLLVFLKLALIGWKELEPQEQKTVGPWEVRYNHFRSLRPRRRAGETAESFKREFDPCGFHFNKRSQKSEICWSGSLAGREVTAFYNKFPVYRCHLNLVPECGEERPQILMRKDHKFAWELAYSLSGLTGIGIGYNAFGALASVNHLHFHLFLEENPLPVTRASWVHNGGSEEYPANCFAFTSFDESWRWLKKIHGNDVLSYNLLYVPGKIYCFPRRLQGTYPQPPWTTGFAWDAFAGSFLTVNRGEYNSVTAEMVCKAFQDVTLSAG